MKITVLMAFLVVGLTSTAMTEQEAKATQSTIQSSTTEMQHFDRKKRMNKKRKRKCKQWGKRSFAG